MIIYMITHTYIYMCVCVVFDGPILSFFCRGKDFSSFVREAAEVDRNRCDGVDEGYAALRVAPNGVPGTVRWDESDADAI